MNRGRTDYMRSFYGAFASYYDQLMDLLYREKDADWRRDAVAELAETDDVVEVGAGTGRTASFAPAVESYVSLDVSQSMLKASDHLDAPVQGDVHALPFADDSFDAAVAVLLMSTQINHEQAVAELDRVVAPDGKIILVDKFSAGSDRQRFVDRLKTRLTYPFAFDFDVDVTELARQNGLEVETRTDVPRNLGMIEKVILR